MKRLLRFFWVCLALPVAAQNDRGITTQAYGGFLFPHHEEMKRQEQHVHGLEVSWYAKGTGYSGMDRHFWNPRWGVGGIFLNLGDSVNGKVMGPHVFIEFDLHQRRRHNTTLRVATGPGYFTRPFDPLLNPRNRSNGSHVNGLLQILINRRQDLGKGLEWQGGAGITHYSNGNWRYPNWGVNMVMLHTGLTWFPWTGKKYDNPWPKYNSDTPALRGFWALSMRMGKRQIAIDDRRDFTLYTADLVYHYPQSRSRLWRFGLNYFFDPVYPYTNFGTWPVRNRRFADVSELAVFAGHEYRVGRIGLTADLGFYLYRPTESKRMYYEAVGFKVYATPRLYFMNRLRVHLFTADYVEWGFAYTLPDKQIRKPLFKNEFVLF